MTVPEPDARSDSQDSLEMLRKNVEEICRDFAERLEQLRALAAVIQEASAPDADEFGQAAALAGINDDLTQKQLAALAHLVNTRDHG